MLLVAGAFHLELEMMFGKYRRMCFLRFFIGRTIPRQDTHLRKSHLIRASQPAGFSFSSETRNTNLKKHMQKEPCGHDIFLGLKLTSIAGKGN
jgi:hypothetical protein